MKRARLLLIDDEREVRESMRRLLALRHDVTGVGTVDEGLALLADQSFDVVLCDLVMPGRSGIHFVDEVAARWPERCPSVALMTGAIIEPERVELFSALGVTLLQKPVSLAELDRVIGLATASG